MYCTVLIMSTEGKQKVVDALTSGFVALHRDDDARSSTSSDPVSGSSSSTSTDSTSNSDTEEEVTPEYLQSLLDKARQNAREEARRVKMLQEEKGTYGLGEEEIIKLSDRENEEEEKYVWEVCYFLYVSLCELDRCRLSILAYSLRHTSSLARLAIKHRPLCEIQRSRTQRPHPLRRLCQHHPKTQTQTGNS